MSGTHGVKETKEGLVAVVKLGKFVAERLKDGVDLGDLSAVVAKLGDEQFKAVVMAGIEGIDKVPAEMGELDLADGLELAMVLPDLLREIQA